MWSVVVLGGEFILLLFIGVVLVGVQRWLLLGGTSSILKPIEVIKVSLLQRGWLLLGGVVKRGFTVLAT